MTKQCCPRWTISLFSSSSLLAWTHTTHSDVWVLVVWADRGGVPSESIRGKGYSTGIRVFRSLPSLARFGGRRVTAGCSVGGRERSLLLSRRLGTPFKQSRRVGDLSAVA